MNATLRLVGIAGGTGSGKSALVQALLLRLGGCVLDVDSYYHDLGHMSALERDRHNYDEPAAVDADLLVEHLRSLAAGKPVKKPVYSFEDHTRVASEIVTPARLMFVEGLFTFWWPAVRELLDLRIFVDAAPDVRLARRLRRDLVERGRSADHVIAQYLGTVRPMYELYVEPLRSHADLVVLNDGPISDAADCVISTLRAQRVDRTSAIAAPYA